MRVMLLVLVALLIPAAAAAAPADVAGEAGRALNEQLERFNRTSEELYRHAENGRYEQALTAIQLLEKQATGMTFTGVTSLEGVEALYAAMLEVKRSLVSMAPDPQRISAQAARVRLAADALLRRPQPMWHQYYRGLRGDLDALQGRTPSSKRMPYARRTRSSKRASPSCGRRS